MSTGCCTSKLPLVFSVPLFIVLRPGSASTQLPYSLSPPPVLMGSMLLGGKHKFFFFFLKMVSKVDQRIVESTLRTTNNLLERLHASFFFYLLPTPSAFMKIGFYLPSVVLIGTSMIFGGLGIWVHTGWVEVPASNKVTGLGPKWGRRARPAIRAISIMVVTHLAGVCLFLVLASETYLINQTVGTLNC